MFWYLTYVIILELLKISRITGRGNLYFRKVLAYYSICPRRGSKTFSKKREGGKKPAHTYYERIHTYKNKIKHTYATPFLCYLFSPSDFILQPRLAPPHPHRSTNCTQMVEKGVHQTVNCVHIKTLRWKKKPSGKSFKCISNLLKFWFFY